MDASSDCCLRWYAYIVSALLEFEANLKDVTIENKSVIDLACEDGNWACFELLKNVADGRYCNAISQQSSTWPVAVRVYPSKFWLELENPFDSYTKEMTLEEFDDMVNATQSLRADGKLDLRVPYPDEKPYLVGESGHLLIQKKPNITHHLSQARFQK